MTKGKDFYGTEIADVIEQACKELGVPRENLDITVLETGSTGIFGLCKKKAHIRVQVKKNTIHAETPVETDRQTGAQQPEQNEHPPAKQQGSGRGKRKGPGKKAVLEKTPDPAADDKQTTAATNGEVQSGSSKQATPSADQDNGTGPVSEDLARIEEKLTRLLVLMELPSTVRVEYTDNTVVCTISGAHEQYIGGQEGKILDSLQYLLRKMIGPHLPDRTTLSLDAAGYREQRFEQLRQQATEFAAQVKQSGKTRAISGLNPAERRAVHLVLQQDSGVRSRSVGSGLFKKILIYKPGKEGKATATRRRGGSGAQQDND
ncbi:MAG: RNA-binding protein [Desulfobulbaceae bacterium]|nr:RNA-binding protein [Desulfobulbaceae bacterium]